MTETLVLKPVSGYESFVDCATEELSQGLRTELSQLPGDWLASADFALMYSVPPAQRVRIRFDATRMVIGASYYREERSLWGGRRLVIYGPSDLSSDEALNLLRERRAVRLDILRMATACLADTGRVTAKTISTVLGEDVVVDLPPTTAELLSRLGRNKRQQLGKYMRRLEREWPSGIEWACLEREQIPERVFAAVVEMNGQRQVNKGKDSSWNATTIRKRWELACSKGLFCGLRLDGKLVSGGIVYLCGEDAYYIVIGHDPEYDYWNLGNLTTWQVLEQCMNRGVRRFHFLWGISEYKLRFGGAIRPLYKVTVYRNIAAWAAASLLERLALPSRALATIARSLIMWSRNSHKSQRIASWLARERPAADPLAPRTRGSDAHGPQTRIRPMSS